MQNTTFGSLLFHVDASDEEEDVLTFSFADEDDTAGVTNDFSVNNITGDIRLTSELDYETDNFHEVQLSCI